ncbi:MAG TPA: isochorismatase family protein [Pelovirga sp.]|nr:isochorismatase family protein [Pelovirga sp.]
MDKIPQFQKNDMLLVVDVQRDFCPGGTLPVEGGDEVVPVINSWMHAGRDARVPIYLSRDWHPRHHPSFEKNGGQWPPHCVQDSNGALFHAQLEIPTEAEIVTKGTRFDQDQNSVFDQTGLAFWLHKQGIKRIFVSGLALDVCVLASVLDGLETEFEMLVIKNATRSITPEGGRNALEKMRQSGAVVLGR